MATVDALKNKLATSPAGAKTIAPQATGLKGMLDLDSTKQKFNEVLDKKAPQFMASMLSLVNNDAYLQKCDPKTILSSAMIAATLDLPIEKNLGYAYLVPYKNSCSFILGYKGYIQLALRSGQYKSINVIEICEGELISFNPLTEELEVDFSQRKSDVVVGYAGYFKLLNGYEKTIYWTKEKMIKHKNKYSKSDFGWKNDFDAMARKTIIRKLIGTWGIMSIEMQTAFSEDTKTMSQNESFTLSETPAEETTPAGADETNFVDAEYITEE